MLFETNRSVGKNYLYTQIDENLSFVGHVHNSFEFIAVTDGKLDCFVYDNRFVLEPGKAMLILPNHIHRYETVENSKSFLCIFSPDYVSDFYNDVKTAGYVGSYFDFTDNGQIAFLNNGNPNKYLVRSVLYEICGYAADGLTRGSFGNGKHEAETKIIEYIQNNYCNEISLKKMADELGYNYSYFSDLFNRLFGCSFSHFVNYLKVEDAAVLLRTTNHSIAKICAYCGFSNLRTFGLQFKKVHGVSPSQYRNGVAANRSSASIGGFDSAIGINPK